MRRHLSLSEAENTAGRTMKADVSQSRNALKITFVLSRSSSIFPVLNFQSAAGWSGSIPVIPVIPVFSLFCGLTAVCLCRRLNTLGRKSSSVICGMRKAHSAHTHPVLWPCLVVKKVPNPVSWRRLVKVTGYVAKCGAFSLYHDGPLKRLALKHSPGDAN